MQLQCQYQHSHPRGPKARGWPFVAARVGGSVAAVEPSLKIGFGIGLTGPLSGNGRAALVAMQIWAEEVNARGGLIDRKVELIYYDDQGNPANLPGIYGKLLDIDKVDLIIAGYGTNMIVPVIPLAMQRGMTLMSLLGLNANERFNYDRYFQIAPTGPDPADAFTRGWQPAPQCAVLAGANHFWRKRPPGNCQLISQRKEH